jgi:hypothetical protein
MHLKEMSGYYLKSQTVVSTNRADPSIFSFSFRTRIENATNHIVNTHDTLALLRLRVQCFQMCSRLSVCMYSPNR